MMRFRSRSGQVIDRLGNGGRGSSETVIGVYDPADLDRRLAAAEARPDIDVQVRRMPKLEDADADPGWPAWDDAPVQAPADGPETATGEGETPAPVQSPSTEGDQHMASDTTYDGVLLSMALAKADAEVKEAEAQQASRNADNLADQMQAMEVDAATLSAMADLQAAHDEVMKAHQKLSETAETVEAALKRGHADLNEAHQNAPVQAATRDFYQA